MSKHNNNLNPSSRRRCRCGKYMTIGEEKAGVGVFGYTCPDCKHREYSPITREQYYKGFNLKQ